jgi:hypothetical protein
MKKKLTPPRCDRKRLPMHPRDDTRDSGDPKPARDVAPGECWAFTDHRTIAEVLAEDLC